MGLPRTGMLRFREVTQAPGEVQVDAKVELTFDPGGTYANPFDPGDIDVTATFTGPTGSILTIPGYYHVPFRRLEDGSPARDGVPSWKVRMAPTEPGEWRYVLRATDRTGTVRSPEGRFRCLPGNSPGFIGVSRTHPAMLAFSSGGIYLPIGINLFHWSRLGRPLPPDRLTSCERSIRRTAEHGGNFIRLRADSWWNAVEMTADAASGSLGIGWFQPQTCWEIDQLYDLCAERGVSAMHCLWNANAVCNPIGADRDWRRPYNPYLQENGGPCADVGDFWTDPEALAHQRRLIRYSVARWGYSRSVMSWEFFNEVSMRPETVDQVVAWHRQMGRFLQELDPWKRPITTSLMGNHDLHRRIWDLPEIAIAQVHVYRRPDIADAMSELVAAEGEPLGKPYYFGEFGIGPLETGEGTYDFDPDCVHVHNGLWASVLSGSCGAAAFWYIDSYLDRHGGYRRFRPLARWLEGLPLASPDRHRIVGISFTFLQPPATLHRLDLSLPTSMAWAFREPPASTFTVAADGSMDNAAYLRPHLYATAGRKAPPSIVVESAEAFQFIIRVETSVGDETNRLLVDLDGRRVLERAFPAGATHGTKQVAVPQYGNWRCTYDEDVVVDVPAGRHTLRLECQGKDRLEVAYRLRDYQVFEYANPLRAIGQAAEDRCWIWVRNRMSNWDLLRRGLQPVPIEGMAVTIPGRRTGTHAYEWFDPWQDAVIARGAVAVPDTGQATVPVPRVERDLALTLRHRP